MASMLSHASCSFMPSASYTPRNTQAERPSVRASPLRRQKNNSLWTSHTGTQKSFWSSGDSNFIGCLHTGLLLTSRYLKSTQQRPHPPMAHGRRSGTLKKNVLRFCDGMNHQRRPMSEKPNHQSNYFTRPSTKQGGSQKQSTVCCSVNLLRSSPRHRIRLGGRHSSKTIQKLPMPQSFEPRV